MVNKIEVLLDAIGRVNNFNNPESECYQLRNPLMIRSFARPGKHEVDGEGRRVFPSLLSGYKAAYYDIELKLKGQSRSNLKINDHLENLLRVYGIREKAAMDNIVSFLRRGLQDMTISTKTELSFFLQENK